MLYTLPTRKFVEGWLFTSPLKSAATSVDTFTTGKDILLSFDSWKISTGTWYATKHFAQEKYWWINEMKCLVFIQQNYFRYSISICESHFLLYSVVLLSREKFWNKLNQSVVAYTVIGAWKLANIWINWSMIIRIGLVRYCSSLLELSLPRKNLLCPSNISRIAHFSLLQCRHSKKNNFFHTTFVNKFRTILHSSVRRQSPRICTVPTNVPTLRRSASIISSLPSIEEIKDIVHEDILEFDSEIKQVCGHMLCC